jgi:4'-phosphopantetheinyl transferase EntD
MLERILPDGVVVACAADDLEVALYPEEEAVVGNAVEKRRREFVTARACARRALEQLGLPAQAIPTGAKGEPLWPAGAVGSITHCAGYRACALARATDLLTIGVDAEPNEPLPDGLIADIALPEERRRLGGLEVAAPGVVSWDRLLFSINESVYKAWFPLAKRWLGFEDAEVEIDLQHQTFSARLLVSGPSVAGTELTGFSGRWLAEGGLLFAAIAVPTGASPDFAQRREPVDD